MKNRVFHKLLRRLTDEQGRPYTVGKIAEGIFSNRAHLNDVLNNKPNHGGNTRWKVVKFLKRIAPCPAPLPIASPRGEGEKKPHWRELLDALGWDENGAVRSSRNVGHETMRST